MFLNKNGTQIFVLFFGFICVICENLRTINYFQLFGNSNITYLSTLPTQRGANIKRPNQPSIMNPSTLIMKFGGTSVGSAEAIANVVNITREARTVWDNVVIVSSAMSGMTNLLLDGATLATEGDAGYHRAAQALRDKHNAAADTLISSRARRAQVKQEVEHLINYFERLCQAISVLGEATPRALDAVASLGERLSVRLIAAALESAETPAQFVEASHLIVTDDQFQDAHPDLDATAEQAAEVLAPLLARGIVPVVTGFIGATPQGVTTTLGRGGSDYSAAILGAVLSANEVWIWTDVDGVMTADPRIVPEARTIASLSYREVAELAYFGAKVLHPKTIRPVVERGIGLRVCNTFNPAHPGTRIVANGTAKKIPAGSAAGSVLKAVTAIKGQKLITVEGRGMLGVPGVAARAFGAVAATGTSVILISQASSEQSICFAVPSEAALLVIAALEKAFADELAQRDIDRIWATGDTVIITVVGAGMQYTPGVSGLVFSALGEAGVNVIAIAQGSSEAAISIMVDAAEAEDAVRALHGLIVRT